MKICRTACFAQINQLILHIFSFDSALIPMRLDFNQVLADLALLKKLDPFELFIIGTPPLGIEIESSDIDIACSASELAHFRSVALTEFENFDNFQCYQSQIQGQDTTIVQFHAHGWDIELFCQTIPTAQQWGVRHFKIEQQILNLAPMLKSVVTKLKRNGMKTEPAFAAALGLSGDPYTAILELENLEPTQLAQMTAKAVQDFKTS